MCYISKIKLPILDCHWGLLKHFSAIDTLLAESSCFGVAWRLTLHGLTLRSARVGTAAAAAKMSRSMVPFASLISTGLRLMNELRTFQRGTGPGTLGRGQTRRTRRRATAGRSRCPGQGPPRTPSRTRTQARNAGARPGPPVRPSHWQQVVGHCVPGTSLSQSQ